MPAKPDCAHPKRLARVQRSLKRLKVDALLVTSVPNVRWLTGFTGDSSAVLTTPKVGLFLTDGRYTEQAEQETRGLEILERKRGMAALVARRAQRLGVSRLGVEAQAMTVASHAELVRVCGATEVVPLSGVIERLREIKDAEERRSIEEAARIAGAAFLQVRQAVRPGRTEKELARMLEAAMMDLGAEGPSFESIVAVGERGSLPHARPTDREVGPGDAVLFDWGALKDGYASDLTRMVYLDTITPLYARIHALVLTAQRRALARIKPGRTAAEVDRAARDYLKARRRGKFFSHSLGHGIGLEVHEAPRLGTGAETRLKPGMVFTVEPGVYLPGKGGVRIEDDVLVTRTGRRILTTAPKSLRDSVIRT